MPSRKRKDRQIIRQLKGDSRPVSTITQALVYSSDEADEPMIELDFKNHDSGYEIVSHRVGSWRVYSKVTAEVVQELPTLAEAVAWIDENPSEKR